MNRVIIAGSRTFNDYELLKRTCDVIFSNFTGGVMAVVSGGAKELTHLVKDMHKNED